MLKNQKGFSLIELMVVVAIIGILAAIAIPNFQKFQERSRQSEAKSALGALYTAEASFYSQYTLYYQDIDTIGYAASGSIIYNVGFAAGSTGVLPTGAPAGACLETCGTVTTTACAATYATWTCNMDGVQAAGAFIAPGGAGVVAASQATAFVAGASGYINNTVGAPADRWTMTQALVLANTQSGL